jgi:hypothetical protein
MLSNTCPLMSVPLSSDNPLVVAAGFLRCPRAVLVLQNRGQRHHTFFLGVLGQETLSSAVAPAACSSAFFEMNASRRPVPQYLSSMPYRHKVLDGLGESSRSLGSIHLCSWWPMLMPSA